MIDVLELVPVLGKIDLQVHGQPIGKVPGLLMRDVVLIVFVGAGLLLLLMLAVRYWHRKKPRKRHVPDASKVFRRPADREDPEAEDAERSRSDRRRYKYRWKRRRHRGRNPTLAETGGLPPARPEEPVRPSG